MYNDKGKMHNGEEKMERQAIEFQKKYGLSERQKNDLVVLQRIMINLVGAGGF